MNEALLRESEKLTRSWMHHERGWLRDYLVAGVEDPRVNVQSIIARHFLIRVIRGERLEAGLMEHEYRFAAVMSWLLKLAPPAAGQEERDAVLFGLRHGADNVEGISIPLWVLPIFASLPASVGGIRIPNYIEQFLGGTDSNKGHLPCQEDVLDTFCHVWTEALRSAQSETIAAKVSVVEPACGSANDYRFLERSGVAPFIDYMGFDLCRKNVENALTLFPSVRFQTGNVFEIDAADKAFDDCVVHDLFEHLSLEGLEVAVREICRVTRKGLCAGFFQMDEIPEHVLRPVDDYHWNLLSMVKLKESFARQGFMGQVLHVGSFMRETTGCDHTHNPNAYTFLLERR